MRPKKSLGQHFLRSKRALEKIVDAAHIQEGETVFEIGSGEGVLTNLLLQKARVVAVETDARLCEKLRDIYAKEISEGKFILIEKDVQEIENISEILPEGYVLVANIPYYLSGYILRRFIGGEYPPKRVVLLLQKEVVKRIIARNGKESILSISITAYGVPKMAGVVPKKAFAPAPKVDSAILSIEHISRDFFNTVSEKVFFEVVKAGFSQKRKMLGNNLKRYGKEECETACFACNIKAEERAEDIALSDWKCLAEHLGVSGTIKS
ncbi:MAG: 16S rRNA (adenine(1518)-N(6)/adenine(1519)-N(6))-dimethyltransferase RsmA [Patescibacteria group bacterium]